MVVQQCNNSTKYGRKILAYSIDEHFDLSRSEVVGELVTVDSTRQAIRCLAGRTRLSHVANP